ncbi:MAG: glycosyltransferase family 4 protein [Gaiellaceae bacterium]
MDRYAESLRAAIQAQGSFSIVEVRPSFGRPRASGRIPAYWYRYPRYLATARRTHFNLNHVLDHSYGHLVYALDGVRTVVTCHDIFPVKHWKGEIEGMPPRRIPPLTVLASLRGSRRAAAVITPSAATKVDLVRHLSFDPAAIHVVPYGLDASFCPFDEHERSDLAGLLPLGGPEARHLLSIDTGGPYKNQAGTLQILARVVESTGLDVRLVRAGTPLAPREQELARSLDVADRVIELGAVATDRMPALYNRCDVLVFPSFYEGFGWPPLEAMGCGLPVVSSRWASLLEVVGDAAPTADATDYDSLASHVIRFLEDPEAAQLAATKALDRASEFTWDRAAMKTAEIYGAMGG